MRRTVNLFEMPPAPKRAKGKKASQTSTSLDGMAPTVTGAPVPLQGLESLDFENSHILSLFGVKPAADSPSKSGFYVMIVKGEKLTTSLILLDNELKL